MNQPLVSVIITNYNYGQFLQEAIDSALNQTYSDIEVVVVDDGSTDNSHNIIKSYGDKIIPVMKVNGGQASAFNAGFVASRGNIICFLDADDIFFPEKVSEVVNIFSSDYDLNWCYHPLQVFANNNSLLIKNKYPWSSRKYDLRASLRKGKLKGKIPHYCPATSGLCFTRSLLQQILPMPEAKGVSISDTYIKFTALALSKGFTLAKELAIQRIHGDNAFTLREDRPELIARIHILTAYWMRKKSPFISKYADNLFARGLGIYWGNGGIETAYKDIVQNYISSLLPLDRLEVNCRAFYNSLKSRRI